ncbi:hypothetical protein Bbelb_428780 [Branchiostoma belcheri]|nr:hypothetical protein Bbelb_428780 [Branchiostoma belcheri]
MLGTFRAMLSRVARGRGYWRSAGVTMNLADFIRRAMRLRLNSRVSSMSLTEHCFSKGADTTVGTNTLPSSTLPVVFTDQLKLNEFVRITLTDLYVVDPRPPATSRTRAETSRVCRPSPVGLGPVTVYRPADLSLCFSHYGERLCRKVKLNVPVDMADIRTYLPTSGGWNSVRKQQPERGEIAEVSINYCVDLCALSWRSLNARCWVAVLGTLTAAVFAGSNTISGRSLRAPGNLRSQRERETVTTRHTCFCVLSTCKNVGNRRASVRGEYHLRTESYGFGSTQTRVRSADSPPVRATYERATYGLRESNFTILTCNCCTDSARSTCVPRTVLASSVLTPHFPVDLLNDHAEHTCTIPVYKDDLTGDCQLVSKMPRKAQKKTTRQDPKKRAAEDTRAASDDEVNRRCTHLQRASEVNSTTTTIHPRSSKNRRDDRQC